jgi:hypothetical protein
MKTPNFRPTTLLFILIMSALALASCDRLEDDIPLAFTATGAPGTPAPSPTTLPAADSSATVSPSETPPAVAAAPTETPTVLFGAIVGGESPIVPPASPSPLPSATPTPQPVTPASSGPFGPIVGPGHTLVPTETRAPTQTAIPSGPFGPIVGPDHTLVPTETRLPPTPIPSIEPTPGPSPTPGPGLQSALMGIQIHPHIDSREIETVITLTRELGVKWVKFQFAWALLESERGRYTEQYFILTDYVKRFHDQGFNVMISVAKAPGWARRATADGIMHEDAPPDNPQDLADFISAVLNHLGRDVHGRPYISAVEVWNEPNLEREWYGHPLTGEEYMRYFRPAYQAVRAFSPEVTVITAGPAPTGTSHWSTDDRVWLRGLYAAGLASYGADVAIGIHPYGWANPPDARCCANPGRGWDDQRQFFFLDTIEDYRTIMVQAGHGEAQLWATEFGWATFDGLRTADNVRPPDPADTAYFGYIDQTAQATYTVRAFHIAQSLPYMGPMILWNLNFAAIGGAVDRGDPKAGYGLIDSLWQPRPVYQYLQQAPKS